MPRAACPGRREAPHELQATQVFILASRYWVALRFRTPEFMPAESASPTPERIRSNRPAELVSANVGDILWVSAKEALVLALVVGILGSVAVGILNGICGRMMPSLPPGLENFPAVTGAPSHAWHASRNVIHRHSFAVLFVVLFVAKSALRLAHYATGPLPRKAAARALRVARRFSRHWFRLLVTNAIAAFVSVLIVQWTQRFSLTHFIWEAIGGVFHAALGGAARLVGGSVPELVERWFSWFGANQTKFAFWLLYSAAICDDLGLPNYKTLARRTWEWLCKALKRGNVSRPTPA
jgi:hypothetical protein